MSEAAVRSGLPEPSQPSDAAQQIVVLNGILQHDFLLPPLTQYNLFVEGLIDVDYVKLAAEIASNERGEDLLEVPQQDGPTLLEPKINIATPCSPEQPRRGGVKYLGRLGRELSGWLRRLDANCTVMFVFDHDEAGRTGRDQLRKDGLKSASQSMTLDPKRFRSCGEKDTAVEDLLSLEIQNQFFESHRACSTWARFSDGEIVQFRWDYPAKEELLEYVKQNATWADVCEIARVLALTREAWGLPTSPSLFAEV